MQIRLEKEHFFWILVVCETLQVELVFVCEFSHCTGWRAGKIDPQWRTKSTQLWHKNDKLVVEVVVSK